MWITSANECNRGNEEKGMVLPLQNRLGLPAEGADGKGSTGQLGPEDTIGTRRRRVRAEG